MDELATPIIGREDELLALEVFLADVSAGASATVLTGQAGAGKTSLWLAGVEQAHGRSFRTLVSRPVEAEVNLSFAPIGDLLEGVEDDVLATVPAPRSTRYG